MTRNTFLFILGLFLTQNSTPAFADWFEEGDQFYFQTSLYTVHFEPKDDHNNNQKLINFEFQKNSNWLGGLAFFRNSLPSSAL
jgi:hypothetical protein